MAVYIWESLDVFEELLNATKGHSDSLRHFIAFFSIFGDVLNDAMARGTDHRCDSLSSEIAVQCLPMSAPISLIHCWPSEKGPACRRIQTKIKGRFMGDESFLLFFVA